MRAVTTKDYSKLLGQYPMWLDVTVERHEVQVNEEYNVYDFTGILGSVGGSLGLFIGFSFLDMILYIINRVWSWCNSGCRCCPQNKKKHLHICQV